MDDAPEALDRILDEVHELEVEGLSTEEAVARCAHALTRLTEAATLLDDVEPAGPGAQRAKVELMVANVTAQVGALTGDDARMEDALRRCDAALERLTAMEPPAPILEVMGLALRGNLLAQQGQLDAAEAHLEEVVAVLEPHVAELQRVEREGSDAERFAVQVADRHVGAERLLLDTERARQEIARLRAAVAGATAQAERLIAEGTPRPLGTRLRTAGKLLAAALGVVVIGWFLGRLITNLLFFIALVAAFSLLATAIRSLFSPR